MARDSIVIVGAGIIGLDVALELSHRGHGSSITIVAEHMPGDMSINYTSPWAGANFSAISGNDTNALRWDRAGYLAMWKLVEDGSSEAKYLKKTKSIEYFDMQPNPDKIESMKGYLKDLTIIPSDQLPTGVNFGISFTTITINAPAHIRNIADLLTLPEYGSVRFLSRRLKSLDDAWLSGNTKIVFNCTGNAAKTLVPDVKSYPTRGQVLLVKAPKVEENIMRHGRNYETYVIPRPGSNGKVILGGYMQKGNSSADVYRSETESILKRTADLLPVLNEPETDLLAVVAGLRPSREGGARVDSESLSGNRLLVHNYGAGGTGYQAGMGMAADAIELAKEPLSRLVVKSSL
ncbi:d-amino acid oxidase [Phlyctema vagabunda]|uniref:D-amino acid oxidase n=1 Tax=Phlyctema vagabunda TaxID=108571 RepID=A0ABR4PPK3_9HELO